MTSHPLDYLTARGFRETSPEALNEALRVVLDSMQTMVHGDAAKELTAEDQAVLREGGLTLEPAPGPDPLANTAVKYAAIVKRSLSSEAAGRRLGLTPGRIRQMIADRSLYSFLIGRNRHIPDFQFQDNRLAPNIARVNKALPPKWTSSTNRPCEALRVRNTGRQAGALFVEGEHFLGNTVRTAPINVTVLVQDLGRREVSRRSPAWSRAVGAKLPNRPRPEAGSEALHGG